MNSTTKTWSTPTTALKIERLERRERPDGRGPKCWSAFGERSWRSDLTGARRTTPPRGPHHRGAGRRLPPGPLRGGRRRLAPLGADHHRDLPHGRGGARRPHRLAAGHPGLQALPPRPQRAAGGRRGRRVSPVAAARRALARAHRRELRLVDALPERPSPRQLEAAWAAARASNEARANLARLLEDQAMSNFSDTRTETR